MQVFTKQNDELPEQASADLPCADKISFESRDKALATAATAQFQYGSRLKVYRCRDCNLWHLASKQV